MGTACLARSGLFGPWSSVFHKSENPKLVAATDRLKSKHSRLTRLTHPRNSCITQDFQILAGGLHQKLHLTLTSWAPKTRRPEAPPITRGCKVSTPRSGVPVHDAPKSPWMGGTSIAPDGCMHVCDTNQTNLWLLDPGRKANVGFASDYIETYIIYYLILQGLGPVGLCMFSKFTYRATFFAV